MLFDFDVITNGLVVQNIKFPPSSAVSYKINKSRHYGPIHQYCRSHLQIKPLMESPLVHPPVLNILVR